MIPALMTFLLAVSLVASVAALAGEAGLRRLGIPTRWVWLGALSLGPLLLAAAVLGRSGLAGSRAGAGVLALVELPPLIVGPDPEAAGANLLAAAAVAVWAACSLALVVLLARTHRLLVRERQGWERARVLASDVFVSANRGPAVAGVLRPWIVLPRWALAIPERELRMVLLHEEEHLRSRDSVLLAAALALVVLTAWNPVTWWQLRRLRVAMELDCDRRVLRGLPDPSTYAESLLTVAARASGPALGLAAFTERSLSLHRRIIAMTTRTTRAARLGGGLLVAVALVVLAQACGVDNPVASDPATSDAVEPSTAVTDLAREPTFTPFTVAPSIQNRGEVLDSMQRSYPPLLRDAGIGGTVVVWFFIDEQGTVQERHINESSGHRALDEAALRVADVYRFSPALNRDQRVPVWVQFPITFQSESFEATEVR